MGERNKASGHCRCQWGATKIRSAPFELKPCSSSTVQRVVPDKGRRLEPFTI